MMKKMLIALLAGLFVSPLYALNEEKRTIEYPKGVPCHFESQTSARLSTFSDAKQTMDTYICEGEDMGVLSVVYYDTREDAKTQNQRVSFELKNDIGGQLESNGLILMMFNKFKHLIRVFRFDEDKRIEYVSLVKTWKGNHDIEYVSHVKTWKDKMTFYHDMEKLEVPATPVTAEE